jgi:guanylate kinase
MKKTLFLLLGPSGAGKSTIGNYMKAQLGLHELVSHTTRAPRVGEQEGVTYYYVTKEAFDNLEKLEQVSYNGNFYCLSRGEVDRKLSEHDVVFTIVDANGIEQVKAIYPDEVVVIYITIPLEEMAHRMHQRGDSESVIQSRLEYAIKTGEHHNGHLADFTIENFDLDTSKRQVDAIIESRLAAGV